MEEEGALWVEEEEVVVLWEGAWVSEAPGWAVTDGNCPCQDYLHFVLLLFCQQYAAKILQFPLGFVLVPQ